MTKDDFEKLRKKYNLEYFGEPLGLKDLKKKKKEEEEKEPETKKQITTEKGKVLNLTGDNYVLCGKYPFWKDGQKGLTISCWVYPKSEDDCHILNQGGGENEMGWSISYNEKKIRIELHNKDSKIAVDNSVTLEKDTWSQIAFSIDESKSVTVFYNGKRCKETGKLNGDSFDVPSSSLLNFGRSSKRGLNFKGYLSEVKIWKKGLSDEEIEKERFNSSIELISKDKDIIGYWKLNGDLKNYSNTDFKFKEIAIGYSPDVPVFVDFQIPKGERDFQLDVYDPDKCWNSIKSIFLDDTFKDLTIEITDKSGNVESIKVHKNIIAQGSSHLLKLVSELSENKLSLKGDIGAYLLIIHYLYFGEIVISSENYNALILIGDDLKLKKIKEKAFEFMVKSLDEKTVLPTLFKAKNNEFPFDATELVGQCLKVLESKIEKIFESDSLYLLDEHLMTELVKSSGLNIDEFDLFNAIKRWGENIVKKDSSKNLKEVVSNLTKYIRFPLLSEGELSIAQKEGYVTKEQYLATVEYRVDPDLFKDSTDPFYKSRSKLFKGSELLTSKWSNLLRKWLKGCVPANKTWVRIFQASKDSFSSYTFHAKCDQKGPTVIVVKSTQGNIFGGFNPESWHSNGSYNYNMKSFIFSLKNKYNKPAKLPYMGSGKSGPYSSSSYGPTFGGGHDFYICNNGNTSASCYSNLGHSYSPPSGFVYGQNNAKEYLAGSYYFQLSEFEVFALSN